MENTLRQHLYIVDAWKKHLNSNPEKEVLSDTSGKHYTRKQVDELSDKIHGFLKMNHIGKEDVVLINLERGVKPIIAMMGVIKTGAAFTLVESGYAKERTKYIYQDCKAKFELNEDNWSTATTSNPISEYEINDDHDLALCVYTSGTSGNPKGVKHEYGQYKLEMISEMQEDGNWRESFDTEFALVAPLNFVASLKMFVHFMYSGGHLHVLDYDVVKNPKKLMSYFYENKINETFLSPSLLRVMGSNFNENMKYVYTGAEVADGVYVENCDVINTYTMSESFFTISEFVTRKAMNKMPIGKPRFDLKIRLVDEEGKDVQAKETGEICFYNPYCRGYINLIEENEKSFKDGWFYTNDLAKQEDGQYYLIGRKDDMVKIAGNRIEPSEIEATCKKELNLSWCAAKGFEKEGTVVLYYTDPIDLNTEETREKLKNVLPYYMIPSYFVKINEIPLTPSGKLNRKELKFPNTTQLEEYVEPRDDFEKELTSTMAEVLGLEKVGIKDDFFSIGGNSIGAIEVLSKISVEDLSAEIFYRGRTVEKIHEIYLAETAQKLSDEEKEKIGRSKKYPLYGMQQWHWFNANNGTHDFIKAYRLSAETNLEKIVEVFNAYMKLNSSFQVVVEMENGQAVQVYKENVPHFEIEYMKEEEIKELQKTFIQPFKYGEPLFRFRFIKTEKNKYLFFHLAHVLTDGAGMHLILQDIETLLNGGTVRPAYYFANVHDMIVPRSEQEMKEAEEYYEKTLDHAHRMRYLRPDKTNKPSMPLTLMTSFPLDRIKEIVSKYNATYVAFINLAACLAVEHYNGQPSLVEPVFDNRSPKENIAGVKATVGGEAITIENGTLEEMFKEVMEQQIGNIRYGYYNFDAHVERSDGLDSFAVTYLQDWFASDSFMNSFGEEIELQNQYAKTSGGTAENNIIVSHEGKDMIVIFHYNAESLSDEHAKEFISYLEFAGNEILDGRVPKFVDKK